MKRKTDAMARSLKIAVALGISFAVIFTLLLVIGIPLIFTNSFPGLMGEGDGKDSLQAPPPPAEQGKASEIYFCPKDACEKILFEIFLGAKKSIHCAIYAINAPELLVLLAEKSREIDVKLVIDDENLIDAEFPIKYDTKSQLSHNKFCIVDGRTAVTGSLNPTKSELPANNNNLIVIDSALLAGSYEDEFRELWSGMFGGGSRVRDPKVMLSGRLYETYFCPEDGCAGKVIENIASAKKSIQFMAFTFTNEAIADALLRKKDIEIMGLFEKREANKKYSQYQRLRDFGIEVKLDSNPRTMHHKVFIIDNETVITGSFNPTQSADTKNDENLLIIHDKAIAKRFAIEFQTLFYE